MQNVPGTSVIKYLPLQRSQNYIYYPLHPLRMLIFQTCSTVKMLPNPKIDCEFLDSQNYKDQIGYCFFKISHSAHVLILHRSCQKF